jgi:uncharacterized protein YndB with AHSA1/START domain
MSSTEMLVRKSIVVGTPPEVAFRVFTEGIGDWWPARTHSVGEDRVEAVVLEGGQGGRFYERLEDGTEHEWGRVTEWDPPHRLAFSWYPGRGSETSQVVEVRFEPEDGGTRVELEQRGWEALGDRAERTLASYDGERGWALVLRAYAENLGEHAA